MKTNLARGAVYLTLSSFIFLISGYVVNIWLGRHLGPELYGLYGVIITIVTIINVMQTSGLPQAIVKYTAQNETIADEILKSALILQIFSGAIITASLFLFSDYLAYLLHDPSLSPYIKISSLIFPTYGVFALYVSYYNGLHNFGRQALMNIVYGIIKTFAVFILGYMLYLPGVIYGFIISPIFPLLIGFHYPKFSRRIFPYKKLIYFSLPLIGFAAFSTLQNSIDLIFVKAILHADENTGYYTASQNISRVPYFILSVLSLILLPSIAKSVGQKLEEKTKKIINKALLYILILLVPSTIILVSTSTQLVELLYSQTYLPAAGSLSILLIGSAFFTIFSLLANVLNGAGSPTNSMVLSFIGVLITILFCPVLIPITGLSGAAIATTIGSFISMLLASIIVYKKFKTLVSPISVIKIFSASFIVLLFAKTIIVPLFFLPVWYIILFAIYSALLMFFKEITKDDIALARSMLPAWMVRKGKK